MNLNLKNRNFIPFEGIGRTSADRLEESMLLWNKHEYQHSPDIFVKNIFNPFHGTGLFSILPEINHKIRGFLMLSGGIERDQCHKMG